MVLWVLLMGSEPGVWRMLDDDPSRADKLGEETDAEIVRFWGSPLRSLFEGGLPRRFADSRLDAKGIRELQRLMPPALRSVRAGRGGGPPRPAEGLLSPRGRGARSR